MIEVALSSSSKILILGGADGNGKASDQIVEVVVGGGEKKPFVDFKPFGARLKDPIAFTDFQACQLENRLFLKTGVERIDYLDLWTLTWNSL